MIKDKHDFYPAFSLGGQIFRKFFALDMPYTYNVI